MWHKLVIPLVVALAVIGVARAETTIQVSPDGDTVTFPNGNQSAAKTTDCKTNSAKVIADFQGYLANAHEPGRLVSCELETSTWFFSVFETDYHAGLFTLEKDGTRSKVAICYNSGVGYVIVKPMSAIARRDLVVFMMADCGEG